MSGYFPPAGGTTPPAIQLAEPSGVTYPTSYTDPITGKAAKVVTFANSRVLAAFGLAGEAFPRIVMCNDPTSGLGFAICVGDGTYDPMVSGGGIVSENAIGTVTLSSAPTGSAIRVGAPILNQNECSQLNTGITLSNSTEGSLGPNLLGGPHGPDSGGISIPGNVGDIWISSTGGAGSLIYQCTVGGAAGVAVWTNRL